MKSNKQSENCLNRAPEGMQQINALATKVSDETIVALALVDESIRSAWLRRNECLVD